MKTNTFETRLKRFDGWDMPRLQCEVIKLEREKQTLIEQRTELFFQLDDWKRLAFLLAENKGQLNKEISND